MKRSKHVALWLTGSLAMTGCHQAPDGSWAWGQPSVTGTNGGQGGYGASSHVWWHSSGGWGDFGGDEGVSRGGFGGHGGGEGFGGE